MLGALEVRRDGQPIALPGVASRRVLAVLALRAGEWVSTDRLIDEVWDERPPTSARKALQMHISRLRQAFGSDAELLTSGAAGYRLAVPADAVDAVRFEQLSARAGDEPEPARARRLLVDALGLWTGEALAGLPMTSERDRLQELRLAAIEQRIDADLRLGRQLDIIGELRELIAEHPWRERLHAQLMLALYRAGRQADALEAYRRAHVELDEGVGITPGPEMRQLQQAILRQDPGLAAPPANRAQVPAPPTPTVGRDDDVRHVGALLDRDDVRLLTLTGTGGVGKTRVALEVARASGARFVSLASIHDSGQIAPAICDALEVARVPGEPVDAALQRALAPPGPPLVLDNLEHLPDAETVVAQLLDELPALTVLATSRTPLGLHAEHRFPVPPLGEAAAVSLFEGRARARDPHVDMVDREAVGEICRSLAGLPLAIELAAARTAVLGVAGVRDRLADALSLLSSGARDAPARQRTLRATLDWSHELLTDDEQRAFAGLAAFAGGCDIEAAEVVTGASLDVLESLVEKGLVTARGGRLSLLEPVRQYAVERLGDDARARHFEYYAALAERDERDLWLRGRAARAFGDLQRERDNLRAALEWSIGSHRALRLVGALERYWWLADADAEGRRWCERALAGVDDRAPVEYVARARLAWAGLYIVPSKIAREQATKALALLEQLGDRRRIALCLLRLGNQHYVDSEDPEAFALAEQAVAHARAAGDAALAGFAVGKMAQASHDLDQARRLVRAGVEALAEAGADDRIAATLSGFAFHALELNEYDDARRCLEQALPHVRAARSPFMAGLVVGNQGLTALLQRRVEDARRHFTEQLDIACEERLEVFYFEAFFGLAMVAAHDGAGTVAAMLHAAAAVHDPRGIMPSEQPVYERIGADYLGPARDELGAVRWKRAAARGRALSVEEAIALARSPGQEPPSATATFEAH